MPLQFNLLRFLAITLIWFVALFFLAIIIFFIIRMVAFYLVGGDFLFSHKDLLKALKISATCSPLCGVGSWLIYRFNTKLTK